MKRRVAVVTGGTGGLGAATARRLVRDGFHVIIIHRGSKQGRSSRDSEADSRPAPPGEREHLVHIHGDVTQERDVRRLVHEAASHGEIRAWVNAVGEFEQMPVDLASIEVWERMFRSNLLSAVLCCREVIPAMRLHGGSIVNIGVARAGAVRATPNTLPYTVAKNGLVALSLTLAKTEGPHNIRVNVVNPGFVVGGEHSPASAAAKIPLGRLGRADEVADAVAFLVSEEAAYITGAVLAVDGGVFL